VRAVAALVAFGCALAAQLITGPSAEDSIATPAAASSGVEPSCRAL
jgi:hypothetical protein